VDPLPVFPRVRQGIEFIAHSEDAGELRITGDDDAGLLYWVRSGSMNTASGSLQGCGSSTRLCRVPRVTPGSPRPW
jgi:hypothetical protein